MIVKIKDCINCPHIIEDSIMEDYICDVETDGVTEYVGDSKWQISGSDQSRICKLK